MKKSIAFLASAALLAACQPAQKTGTVSGTLTGVENDTLLVTSIPMDGGKGRTMEKDTLIMQNGAFTFQAACDTVPYQIIMQTPQSNNNYLRLVLLPGESLQVSGTMTDYQVEGSAFNTALQEVLATLWPYEQKLDSLSQILTRLDEEQGEGSKEEIEKIYNESYRPVIQQMMDTRLSYVKQHPDSDVSLYLLSQAGLDNLRELLPTLTDQVKNGPLAPLYRTFEKAIQEADAREAAKEKIKEGLPAPDFTLKDLQGNDLSLASLRSKYVVLDFWGSWCGWCIKGIPDMKKYYEKYKAKMEILGIDCRDTEEKWRAAVEKYELPWLHVRNEGDPDVSILYAIQGYPTKIVVDPEGKIAKVVVGEDPAFYEYLDSLFK